MVLSILLVEVTAGVALFGRCAYLTGHFASHYTADTNFAAVAALKSQSSVDQRA